MEDLKKESDYGNISTFPLVVNQDIKKKVF